MMNVDNDDAEPVTDLGLVLTYSNQYIQTRLSYPGAGVNAASRADMTFVASDPLSELVWSPHNGLSLRCADFSFAEKKPSLLWDVRQSNMVLSPPQSITSRETTSATPTEEEILITSQVAFHAGREVGEGASLVTSPRSMAGIKPVFGSSHRYHAGPEDQKTIDFLRHRTNESGPDMAQSERLSGEHNYMMRANPSGGGGDVAGGSQTLGVEVALSSADQSMKQCKGIDNPAPNLISPGGNKDLSLVIEEESKNKMKIDVSTSVPPLEKLESTSENALLQIGKDACGNSEERLPRDSSVPSEASPTNCRIRLDRRKGKEKASSDGYANERTSKDGDDSHESVESCNSARLFVKGKKRWSFEQQLTVGSKRVKKQIQEGPASTSFVGQDSSFMSWISNMVKGLNKTSQVEAPSHALTLARPIHGDESRDHKIITYSRNHDPGSKNTGFQTIFQSLYCSNPKEQETKMSNGNSPIEGGSQELVLANKMPGANITQIACQGENDKVCKKYFLSNEKFNQSSLGNGAGPPVKPKITSANIAAASEMCKTSSCSDQNKTACNLACINVKEERISSSSSLGKRKIDSAENNYSDPREAKVINNVGYRCDHLGSLWITRFSAKTPGPTLNLDFNQNTNEALESSTDCTRLAPYTHNRVDFPIEQKSSETKEYSTEDPVNVVGKELQNYAPSAKAAFGFKRIHGHKLNRILPSPKFKNSEAMASIFARRLDALKHIKQSDVKDIVTHTMTTCFYCGRSGHDLRGCSEITETELKELIRNISSYDGAEESPCLCIRCFQVDHWAISCPTASTTRHHQSEHGAALGNDFTDSKMHLMRGNERYPKMLKTKQSHSQVAENSRVDIDKLVASLSRDNVLKEKQITPLCNLVDRKFSDVPKGMFDAIRKLRLSRMDILKWMNSDTSLLHLDGFFLRLRFGKWEEGLGGTGYHVACITGEQREKLPQGCKKPISVNMWGRRCLVESQYISNQDFLEDELIAWWCATTRSGGKIPSEDHLKLKLQERKRLGF